MSWTVHRRSTGTGLVSRVREPISNQGQVFAANEDLTCNHVRRHIEDARIQQLAAHSIECGEPLSSDKRLISQQRRSNLL